LIKRDIGYKTHDEDLVITMMVNGEDLPQPTMIAELEEREIIQVFSPIPGKISEDMRIDAAVAVSVANHEMVNGCFELNMGDGHIRFRIAQSYTCLEISEEFIYYILAVTFLLPIGTMTDSSCLEKV